MTARPKPILIEISPGELVDRMTILQIKAKRMKDRAKLRHVRAELATLWRIRADRINDQPRYNELARELRQVNGRLWLVEDELRACETRGDFGTRFVELARSVYRLNDRRFELKRRVNQLAGASIVEQKEFGANSARRRSRRIKGT